MNIETQWKTLGPETDIPEGEVRVFTIEEERVAVCRAEGTLYAIEDTCTHDDGPLGQGEIEGFEIECPRHGARFDIRSGEVRRMPATYPIRTFPVRVTDGMVEVQIEVD